MKRIIIIILICPLLFLPTIAETQIYSPQNGVCIFTENSVAGLIDIDGNILIDAQFDEIQPFGSSEYTIVTYGDQQGVVHQSGALTIPCNWDSIELYPELHVAVCESQNNADDAGYDQSPSLSTILDIHNGSIITDSCVDFITCGGVGFSYEEAPNGIHHFTRIVSDHGQTISEVIGHYLDYFEDEQLFAFALENDNYAVIDRTAKEVFTLSNGWIYDIRDGQIYYYRFEESGSSETVRICGVADANGITLEVPVYSIEGPEVDGIWRITTGGHDEDPWSFSDYGLYGYMDANGEVLIVPQYDYATPFIDGVAAIRNGNEWQMIYSDGSAYSGTSWSFGQDYADEYLAYPFINGWPVFPVGQNGSIYLLSRQGYPAGDELFLYQEVPYMYDDSEEYIYLRDRNERICLFCHGEEITRVHADAFAAPYLENHIWWISLDTKWGCVDISNGENPVWIVEPLYDEICDYDEWLIARNSDGSEVYLSIDGKILGPAR